MGNDVPRSCANRLAIGAMMSVTSVEKGEIKKMRDRLVDLGGRSGNPNVVTREEFDEGLGGVDLVDSDKEIFDRLFVMLDRTGEERVNLKEFIVGVVPLITSTTAGKLKFALDMFDVGDFGKLKYADARFVLATLNAVASYFGDPVLRSDQIDELVDEAVLAVDPKKTGHFTIDDITTFVARHPLMTDFLEAKGSARYGNFP